MPAHSALKERAASALEARRDDLIEICQQLWKNPETGFREFKTAARAAAWLRDLGLTVQENIAVTGLKSEINGGAPGPVIALFGEMDALILPGHPDADPLTGAVHACGHHTHLTALLGAAAALLPVMPELAGKLLLLGAPAEECIELEYRADLIRQGKIQLLGGKQNLLLCGALDEADIGLMCHVGGGYNGMDSNGFCKKICRFHGVSCHAASPQRGVNALNAATLALNAIALMRETFANDPTIRVHGIMSRGGDSINIIPDCTQLEYQIRTDTQEKLQIIGERFDRAMRGCADALGATVDITTFKGYLPMRNHPALFAMFADTVREVTGRPDLSPEPRFDPGCTDMGDVSQVMPAIHPFFPGGTGGCHTTAFQVPDPAAALHAARLLAFLVIDLLADNATKGRQIAAEKQHCIPIAEYRKMMSAG